MRHESTFPITLLDDNREPIRELGQITGVMEIGGEPSPYRNLEGEADQRLLKYIDQSPSELPLRIADIKAMMPTIDGRWLVTHERDRWVAITSQGKITSHLNGVEALGMPQGSTKLAYTGIQSLRTRPLIRGGVNANKGLSSPGVEQTVALKKRRLLGPALLSFLKLD